jgi:hypothetical protein
MSAMPDRPARRSVLGPQPAGEPWTTAGRSGHQTFVEAGGHSTCSVLTLGGRDRRHVVLVSPPGCREPSGHLPAGRWSPRTGLTLRSSWEPSPYGWGAALFSPAVPSACHKQRSRAVCSGQSRSLETTVALGSGSLTWGGEEVRNCMACKRSPTGPWETRTGTDERTCWSVLLGA